MAALNRFIPLFEFHSLTAQRRFRNPDRPSTESSFRTTTALRYVDPLHPRAV
jgi:hypothetical protein